MMKAEIHRILQNPIYTGDFRWLGTLYRGSHDPLVSRGRFADVQAVLNSEPRARYSRQRHAFMGLLTCARCGCGMTAEKKKGKYVYYRCTGFHGSKTAFRRLEPRRRAVTAKLDRGYDDYVDGRISEDFWNRKSQEWEVELQIVDAERSHLEQPRDRPSNSRSGRTASTARNGAIELHVRSRNSLSYLQ